MASNNIVNASDSRKYTLPLDALDLNFLGGARQLRTNDRTVLWSRKKHGDDYYEFEIKSSDNTVREVDKHEPKMETHKFCHICNIFVPNAYVSEHINSIKHKSYKTIAYTALERVNKQTEMHQKDEKVEQSQYFCENCVSVVSVSKRDEHIMSKKHKNFTTLDKFLHNFATFYTNEFEDDIILDDIDIACLKVNKKFRKNKDEIQEETSNEDVANSNIDETKLKLDDKLKEAKELINDVASSLEAKEAITSTDDESEEANAVDNLKQYIKLLKRYGTVILYTINAYDQDKVRVEALDGSELEISVNNFHGLKTSGGNFVKCLLCKVFVANLNEHKIADKHIKIVAQPFADKHSLRHIHDSWSHCAICNELTANNAAHINFNLHIRKLSRALITNETDTKATDREKKTLLPLPKHDDEAITSITNNNTIDNSNFKINDMNGEYLLNIDENDKDQYFCDTCNRWMHINNKELHLNGMKHMMNTNNSYSYLMRKHLNGLTCKVCDCSVKIYVWAVESHLASTTHNINYYKLLADNKIVKNKDKFHCNICSLEILQMNEISHIDDQKHKVKLATDKINRILSLECSELMKDVDEKLIELDDKKTKPENESHSCEDVTNDEESIKVGSELDKDEKTNTKSDFNNILYECDACDEVFNEADKIKLHNEGKHHKRMDLLISRLNNLLGELLQYCNNSPEIHDHLERTDTATEYNCKVCSSKVGIDDVDKHTTSLKHIHNHTDFVNANKMKLKNDKYVCYACNVFVDSSKEIRHVESEKHVQRIESLKNGDYVLVTTDTKKLIDKISNDLKATEYKIEISRAKRDDFINTAKIESNDKHFAKPLENDSKLICLFCLDVIASTAEDVTAHVGDLEHRVNYEAVMVHNQVFGAGNRFVCGFCECAVTSDVDHIITEKHITNANEDPKKNYCYKCGVPTSEIGLREHMTSERHIKNLYTSVYYYCNVCDLKLSNDEENIVRHKSGFQHKNNNYLREEHKIVLDSKKCYCQKCEIGFSREKLEKHINSWDHLMLD